MNNKTSTIKYPVCLSTEQINELLEDLTQLGAVLPAGKAKVGFEQFEKAFDEAMGMESGPNSGHEGCVPSEAPIDTGTLQELWEISDCLEGLCMVFEEANSDSYNPALSILRPIMRQVRRIAGGFPEFVRTMA